jgi:hypothetical protein
VHAFVTKNSETLQTPARNPPSPIPSNTDLALTKDIRSRQGKALQVRIEALRLMQIAAKFVF